WWYKSTRTTSNHPVHFCRIHNGDDLMNIEDSPLDEWIDTLKPYQKSTIKQLSDSYEEEEIAKKWLSARGPSSTIGFGGISNPEPFFDRFMEEFRKFICGDEAYADF